MIHNLLRSAAIAAALLTFATAQETQTPSGGDQRTERPHPKPRRDVGSQPAGETKPMRSGDEQMTPRERAKRYMDAHPEVRKQLMEQADTDGDGKLNESERKTMMELVEAKMKAVREERKEQVEEKREERKENREEQADTMRKRADRNGDGTVDETEQQRAKEVRSEVREKRQERADRNDDGRVGPRERERAQEVREERQENGGERPRADKKKPRPAPTGGGS